MRFLRDCWFVIVPLVLIMITTLVMVGGGVNQRTIVLFSEGGTALVLLAMVVHILFFDSRKRWPGLSLWQRYVRYITFDY